MFETVTLSDNKPCQVRRLRLYELDAMPFEELGPYIYQYENGQEQAYTLADFDEEARTHPDKPQDLCEKGTYEWSRWNRYNMYRTVLTHRLKQVRAAEAHAKAITDYILTNCIEAADQLRIVTVEDFEKIYQAAMVVEVTLEDIARVLAGTFPGYIWQFADIGSHQGVAVG